MTYHLLRIIYVSPSEVSGLIKQVRAKQYDVPSEFFMANNPLIRATQPLKSCTLLCFLTVLMPPIKQLGELKLGDLGVSIIPIRHIDEAPHAPRQKSKLCENDILVLFGNNVAIISAELKMLTGRKK
jgi:hypothetical protein